MLSPRLLINLAIPTALSVVLILFYIVLQQPYLGFTLVNDSSSNKPVVTSLEPWVADAGLRLGDQLLVITATDGKTIQLERRHFPSSTLERRQYYKNKKDLFVEQAKLYRVLSQPDLRLSLADGRQVQLPMGGKRSLANLPLSTWLTLLFGLAAWLVGLTIWAWHPEKRETTCLMLSGLGLFITTIPSAIYHIEMGILHPLMTWGLSYTFAFGQYCFLAFALCVLIYFPQRLNKVSILQRWILGGTASLAAFTFLNKWDFSAPLLEQYLYVSDSELYLITFAAYPVGVLFCFLQWRSSRNKPVERVRASWVLLSWMVGPSIYMVFYILPMSMGWEPPLSRTWAWAAVMSAYWMLLIVIGKFRLLQLERHIGTAWLWVVITIFFFALDILLVSVVDLTPQTSMLLILLIVLWGYLPARLLLYQRLSGKRKHRYNRILHEAVTALMNDSLKNNYNAVESWKKLLISAYAPVSVCQCDHQGGTTIQRSGQGLLVSANRFSPAFFIEYAENGARLFCQEDKDLVNTLQLLFERLSEFRNAFTAGQAQERDRIRRDLHDQIGYNLLSLIYAAKDDKARHLAQDTLEQLRGIIRALRDEPVVLNTMIAELKNLSEDICGDVDIELHWRDDIEISDAEISSHQYLNILNISRELLNNAICHADASRISIGLSKQAEKLTLVLSDNGVGFNHEMVQRGNGLNNIHSRAQELGATIHWNSECGTQAALQVPINT